MKVERSTTIMRPRAEVYAYWRDLEQLPTFMYHLESVEETDANHSHWIARAPGGRTVEWDAEIVEDVPNEFISWRSVGDEDSVRNAGTVRFLTAPADRGTEVHVSLSYDSPVGAAGKMVAKLLGEDPDQQVRDDLRRLKQALETGEVLRSEGSLEGAGQGARKQRASQAPEREGAR